MSDVILGSSSPRRLDLLRAIGVEPRVVVPDVDESVQTGELPDQYVRRVASAKLDAVMRQVGSVAVGTVVMAADTTVDVDGEIFAKPTDADDARRMLHTLSGRAHLVHTG
ncbi:MAG: septum formation inhibitor Maf, partial [Actinobacteria bacterium]|nr:septum formation inhibitor Maf [Actinomycetota bacterium]